MCMHFYVYASLNWYYICSLHYSDADPSNDTIKIKPTEETVNKCAQDKQAVEKQQNTSKRTGKYII